LVIRIFSAFGHTCQALPETLAFAQQIFPQQTTKTKRRDKIAKFAIFQSAICTNRFGKTNSVELQGAQRRRKLASPPITIASLKESRRPEFPETDETTEL